MNLNQFKRPGLSQETLFWIDHNLNNFLKKENKSFNISVQEIEHIVDFLESDEAPKRLKKMSFEEAQTKAQEWTERLRKKAAGVVETEEDTEVILNFENGFKLVKLVGKNAFEREGNLMRHCVSSYFGKTDTKIYSLRDRNNNPHCTIEVTSNDCINQIKGKGNGSIHPKYVEMVIKTLEYLGNDIREADLPNLGYTKLSVGLQDIIDKNFKGAKYLTFNNKRFFYNYSNLEK